MFSWGQKNIPAGMGVIKVDHTKLPLLEFYDDTIQFKSIKSVLVGKTSDGEYFIKNRKETDTWFVPEQLYLDYDIFILRVDSIIGRWYKVIVNMETGRSMWTKKAPYKKFIRWSTFLLTETTSIDKGFEDLDIKFAPNESSKNIRKISEGECFEALEIQGDWLRVTTNTILDCNESVKPIKSGWIRWRKGNRLMIGYGLTC